MKYHVPPDIVEAYVFANTPAYLFRKLAASEFISKLMAHDASDLIRFVDKVDSQNVESLALAYAALLAAMRKGNTNEVLNLPTLSKLDWGTNLISLYRQKTIPVSLNRVRTPTVTSSPVVVPIVDQSESVNVVKVPKC